MMRRTLTSESPRPEAAREDTASDLGRWLTRDLRPKGAVPEPVSTERVKLTGNGVVNETAPEFSRWLLADLRPRNSSPPPVDSFAPQMVNEELAIQHVPLDVALDAQDLAVLPPRRGNAKRYGQRAALALVLLASIGLVARFGFGPGQPGTGVSIPASSPVAAATLPAAPESVESVDEPDPLTPAVTPTRHPAPVAVPALAPAVPESLMPRGRRNGSAVARFADLPSPTLSRLAKDERQDTHAHDASVRAAAKRSPVPPATSSSSH